MNTSTWPRTDPFNPETHCKGTKKGIYHWVNPPGTGGATRKMNRRLRYVYKMNDDAIKEFIKKINSESESPEPK